MPLKKQYSLLFLFLLLACGVGQLHAQRVAVKTNVLMDAAMVANGGVEFVTGERSTVELNLYGTSNVYGHPFKLLATAPEFRYWFNGRPMTREFFGAALLGAHYDIEWGKRLYEGDAFGAGLTMGYVFNLGKRLNIEATGGFGAIYFRQKQYYLSDNYDDFHLSPAARVNATGWKFFPMKLAVAVSYILW